jgi:Cys-tRNA(Pro) deacylase
VPTTPSAQPGHGQGDGQARASAAADRAGLTYRTIRHGPVRGLAEAAEARGVEPADVIKSLVVRRAEDDFVIVLIPGDRSLSWPKLRGLLGVNRLSMPDAAAAREATGYERGTITPLGALGAWPVVADARMVGRTVTLGGGAHGVALKVSADAVLAALDAEVADVSDPADPPGSAPA